jgi:hypothetical protein
VTSRLNPAIVHSQEDFVGVHFNNLLLIQKSIQSDPERFFKTGIPPFSGKWKSFLIRSARPQNLNSSNVSLNLTTPVYLLL